jgi:hypothetical protein
MTMKGFQFFAFSLLLISGAVYAQQPGAVPAAAPAAEEAAVPAATTGAPEPADAANAAAPAPATAAAGASAGDAQKSATLASEDISKPFNGSFFLTPLEVAAIQRALAGHVLKDQTLQGENQSVRTRRMIRVGGVFYKSPANWIVWIDNHKMTHEKDTWLPEIVNMSVKNSSKVSLEWYDVGLNQVLSLTLRPDQTYDIPTGILLPGTH